MQLERFQVTNYRNVLHSGWVEVNRVTGFVGQNESGKSNLCEALYLLNPFEAEATYKLNEDWPADNWGGRDQNGIVCEAEFTLTPEEIKSLFDYERQIIPDEPSAPPAEMRLTISRRYDGNRDYKFTNYVGKLDQAQIEAWALPLTPKCVYIREYDMSGTTTELDQLAQRLRQHGWNGLGNEDQTILIILQLANIEIEDFLQKGQTPEGRTLRAFDKRQASAYLTQQFAKLWKQKEVRFDIEVDATTLNIFAEDVGLGMPVRLSRRSTGFRWYVSFAWKFTHATKGDYKNCILLLEEPGIHLHHAGHRDLLELFDRLAADDNTVIYTTHLSTMLDQGYPERIRIVEVRDHHSRVVNGMVSDQKKPMMVIEARLGLTGEMSGLLGNRQTLIVEGGDDALILQKLSGVLRKAGREGLSDRIYPMPADGASKTPMYAGFLIGQGWDAAVLLDSDGAGEKARKKIKELYLDKLGQGAKFRVFMLGSAAGITQNESSIEDIFPREFYLDCVNTAYGIAIREADLPVDGSPLIADRVEQVLQKKHGRAKLDTALVMKELMKRFDGWDDVGKLPPGLADRAEKLFAAINAGFK
jgi:hypothetical protein